MSAERANNSSAQATTNAITHNCNTGAQALPRPKTSSCFSKIGKFRKKCKATPAIAGGKIYLRTDNTLYCFAEKNW